MPTHAEQRVIGYAPEQIYQLVADVDATNLPLVRSLNLNAIEYQ